MILIVVCYGNNISCYLICITVVVHSKTNSNLLVCSTICLTGYLVSSLCSDRKLFSRHIAMFSLNNQDGAMFLLFPISTSTIKKLGVRSPTDIFQPCHELIIMIRPRYNDLRIKPCFTKNNFCFMTRDNEDRNECD